MTGVTRAQQLVSNGESVFITSESDTFSNFTTYDLTFNTSSSNTPLTLTLSPAGATPPTLDVVFGGINQNGAYNATVNGGILTSSFGELDATAAGTLTLNSALADASGTPVLLTMSGTGTLVLTNTSSANTISGGIDLLGGTVQISSDLNLGANTGNSNGVNLTGGTLLVTSGINFNPARVFTVNSGNGTFYANAGTVSTLPGVNQLVAGTSGGTFTKDGPGTLILGAANSFAGPVRINNGILQLNALGSLGSPGSQSTITLGNNGQLNLRYDGPFTIDGNGNNSASFGNNVVINGANTAIDVGFLNTNGPVGNIQLGALNFPMDATLNVTNATASNRTLEFAGTTTIGQGTGSAAVTINNTPDVRLGGQLTGNGSLTKTGPGVLYLSGTAPNTYASYTNVSGGTLVLAKSVGTNSVPGDLTILGGTVVLQTPGQIAATSNVTVSSGTLNVNSQTDTVNALNNSGGTVMTGSGTLSVTSPDTTDLTSGTTLINAGGTLNSLHLAVTGGTNIVQPGGSIAVGSIGIGFESVAPASGQSQVNPTLTLQGDSTDPGKLLLQGPLNYTSDPGSSGVGSINTSGSGGLSGVVDLGGAARVFTISPLASGQAATTVNMAISASIQNGGVDKEGTGTLQLSGANTYSGGTTIGAGTLQLAGGGTLGGGPVNFTGGTLDLTTDFSSASIPNVLSSNGPSIFLTVNRLNSGTIEPFTFQVGGLNLGSAINLSGSTNGTLIVDGPVVLSQNTAFNLATNLVINGMISSSPTPGFGITVSGAGSLTIGGSSSNTYGGLTTVSSGTIILNKASATAVPGNLVIGPLGTIVLGSSEQIADTSQLSLNSSGGLASFNVNNFTETVGSLLDTGSGGSILLGLTGSGSLTFGGNGDNQIFTGIVSGNGVLIKTGGGSYNFSGADTYVGGATVVAGTLTFAQNPAQVTTSNLGGGTWTVYSGATLNFPAGDSFTNNSATVVLNGTSPAFPALNNLSTNLGTLSITNGNTFSSNIFSNSGVVTVGGGIAGSSFTVSSNLAQIAGNTLTGGTWNLLPGGTIFPPSGTIITTIGPAATVNLSGGAFTGLSSGLANKGTLTIASQAFAPGAGFTNDGTLNLVSGATVSFPMGVVNATGALGSAGVTNVASGTTLSTADIRQNTLNLTGRVAILPRGAGGLVSVVDHLNVSVPGTLDLANTAIDLPGAQLSAVIALIAQGYNQGSWTGTGITSSAAAADANHLTAVAVLLNDDGFGNPIYSPSLTTPPDPRKLGLFQGTTPGLDDVLVAVTYFGDANLDGKVDGSDYSLIDAGYASHSSKSGWSNGDFNYDGVIDGSDYTLADNAFNNQSAGLGPSALTASITAETAGPLVVPEPASFCSVLLLLTAATTRRVRHVETDSI